MLDSFLYALLMANQPPPKDIPVECDRSGCYEYKTTRRIALPVNGVRVPRLKVVPGLDGSVRLRELEE